MSKRPDTDPIVLDDIDPNSEWVVETQPPEFGDDIDVELEDLLDVPLDADPLLPMPSVHTGVDAETERAVLGMAGTSRSRPRTYSRRRRRHLASTTTSLADDFDPEEPETEPDHDAFASPSGSSSSSSSSSGAEFDDDH